MLALDGPEIAGRMNGSLSGRASGIARADAVIALTRDRALSAALSAPGVRLLQRDPAPPSDLHASHWLAAPVRSLGADPAPDPPTLSFTAAERSAVAERVSSLPPRFLAVHPGSGSAAKNWPADRFAALVQRHARDTRWLLVTGPADEGAADALRCLPGAVVAQELPLRELAALLAHAGLYVGNDSGVSHLAAATGVPTLALFGPTAPSTWAPVGPRVATLASPDGTMTGLDLDTVSAAVGQRL